MPGRKLCLGLFNWLGAHRLLQPLSRRPGSSHNSDLIMKHDTGNRLTLSTYSSRTPRDSGDWISQSEAARIRDVSRQAISRLIKKGRFNTLTIGGKVLLKRSEVEAYQPEPPGRKSK